jgi:biofilm protein TabA
MIHDTLNSSHLYDALSPRFATAFAWLRKTEPSGLVEGKQAIDGDDVFVLVQKTGSKPLESTKWEAHKKYADIQFVVHGTELMQFAPLEKVTTKDYVAEKDFVPLETKVWNEVTVSAGSFAVFLPTDAHRPGIQPAGEAPTYKLVVKVRV